MLPITENISDNEFFNYEAKYKGKSDEVTPADLNSEMMIKVKALTHHIYDILGMKGIARVDYIIDSNKNPYVIEINSVPGMSKESIVPQMVEIEGIGLEELFGEVISTTMDIR